MAGLCCTGTGPGARRQRAPGAGGPGLAGAPCRAARRRAGPLSPAGDQRYREWIAAQEAAGRTFTSAQRWWLDSIAAHIGVNLSISAEDLNASPFFEKGGQVAAAKTFGRELPVLLDELNQALSE